MLAEYITGLAESSAFVLWPTCTRGFGIWEKIRCGFRFFGVFLCGFAVFGPPLRPPQYTIPFTGVCSVILSIFCQMYLFFCYNSQRFLTTVNVWPLVNNVHIAVHDR